MAGQHVAARTVPPLHQGPGQPGVAGAALGIGYLPGDRDGTEVLGWAQTGHIICEVFQEVKVSLQVTAGDFLNWCLDCQIVLQKYITLGHFRDSKNRVCFFFFFVETEESSGLFSNSFEHQEIKQNGLFCERILVPMNSNMSVQWQKKEVLSEVPENFLVNLFLLKNWGEV